MKNYNKIIKNGLCKYYLLNKKPHRIDGPAVEWHGGSKEWWVNGKLHREDGPAIEWYNGEKQYYLFGFILTRNEFSYITKNNENYKYNL